LQNLGTIVRVKDCAEEHIYNGGLDGKIHCKNREMNVYKVVLKEMVSLALFGEISSRM
jgi:hypothetical protein